MKKGFIQFIPLIIGGLFMVVIIGFYLLSQQSKENQQFGATICYPYQGCLGTSTPPVYGQIPVGKIGRASCRERV